MEATAVFAESFRVESRDLTLDLEKIDTEQGQGFRVVSLLDKRTETVFAKQPNRPLFSLFFRNVKNPAETYCVLADSVWKNVDVSRKNDSLVIRWTGLPQITGTERLTVEMRIEANPNRDGIEISQSAQAKSDAISLTSMRLGQFALWEFGQNQKLFYPFRSGVVAEKPLDQSFHWSAGYPGFDVAMPWFVLWNENTSGDGNFRSRDNCGLYLGFHDPLGCRKTLTCTAKREENGYSWPNTISFWSEAVAENYGEPNNEIGIGGRAVLRSIRDDWYDGAMVYRDFVRKEAKWYPRDKMDENGRTDTPLWFKEHSLWAMYRVNPDEMIPAMQKLRDAFGVPAAVHWYYWHKNPYDNDYPHFFPRPGFHEAVAEMQKDHDIYIMPYTNGLLWDSRDRGLEDWLFTKEALPGVVKKEDGSALIHSYGSKESDGSDVKLGHMCPATNVWQNKVRENTLRLLNTCGTQAVYIDQVAAAIPELCFDRTHGHPLGGGHWWSDGYTKMLTRIRADMRKEVPDFPFCEEVKQRLQSNPNALKDRVLTTECTGETSLNIVDGFLTWHHQLENQVPAFSAVYGGAIQQIGRDYRAGKTYAERTEPRMKTTNEPLACRMKSAEAFVFGEQIGWFVPTIIEEPDKFPFQRKVVRLRHQLRHYFYKGEMGRPAEFAKDLPKVTADWNYYDSPLISAPSVRVGCWKIAPNGQTESVVLVFANTSNESISCRLRWSPDDYGWNLGDRFTIQKYDPEGPRGASESWNPQTLDQPITFPPESVFAWEIRR